MPIRVVGVGPDGQPIESDVAEGVCTGVIVRTSNVSGEVYMSRDNVNESLVPNTGIDLMTGLPLSGEEYLEPTYFRVVNGTIDLDLCNTSGDVIAQIGLVSGEYFVFDATDLDSYLEQDPTHPECWFCFYGRNNPKPPKPPWAWW